MAHAMPSFSSPGEKTSLSENCHQSIEIQEIRVIVVQAVFRVPHGRPIVDDRDVGHETDRPADDRIRAAAPFGLIHLGNHEHQFATTLVRETVGLVHERGNRHLVTIETLRVKALAVDKITTEGDGEHH